MIQHLVFSGGGPSGMMTYGAAKALAQRGLWRLEDIKSVYATSMGALIAVMLMLDYEWEVIDDYLIKRPWHRITDVTARQYVEAIYSKGVMNGAFCHEALTPLLEAKDLDPCINLEQFYEVTKIELHAYTVDLNTDCLTKVDLSYKTHPHLKLTDAIKMSSGYPLVFPPSFVEGGGCYIDGGMLNNFPVNDCLRQMEPDPDDVLAFKVVFGKKKTQQAIDEDSTLFDMLGAILKKMGRMIDTTSSQTRVQHEVKCLVENDEGYSTWVECMRSSELRAHLISEGIKQGELFYEYAISRKDTPSEDSVTADP
jgi:predicted acylesterase/phospholipase RssA